MGVIAAVEIVDAEAEGWGHRPEGTAKAAAPDRNDRVRPPTVGVAPTDGCGEPCSRTALRNRTSRLGHLPDTSAAGI